MPIDLNALLKKKPLGPTDTQVPDEMAAEMASQAEPTDDVLAQIAAEQQARMSAQSMPVSQGMLADDELSQNALKFKSFAPLYEQDRTKLQQYMQDYANTGGGVDLTPAAALISKWSNNPALFQAAQAAAPESRAEKAKNLIKMQSGLTDSELDHIKNLLSQQGMAANRQATIEAARIAAGKRNENAQIDDEAKLRNDWLKNDLTKKTQDVSSAYNKVVGAAENPSAAGDLSLIFGYMKILDPGSVVREGEFATAQSAAGVPDRIRNLYNRVQSGERLNQDQRADFVRSAGTAWAGQMSQQEKLNQEFEGLAQSYGYSPDRIVRRGLFKAPEVKDNRNDKMKRLEELRKKASE